VRGARELVGSFGAGASLAIAGSLCLMLISSVMAFRGWPDDLNGSIRPALAQLSAEPARRVLRDIALPPEALPRAVARGRSTRLAGSRRSPETGVVPRRPDPSRGVPDASGGAPEAATSVPVSRVPGVPHTVGSKVAGAVHQVGSAVTQITTSVSDAVSPLAPSLSGALESVGAGGGALVDAAGLTVGSALP